MAETPQQKMDRKAENRRRKSRGLKPLKAPAATSSERPTSAKTWEPGKRRFRESSASAAGRARGVAKAQTNVGVAENQDAAKAAIAKRALEMKEEAAPKKKPGKKLSRSFQPGRNFRR